MSNTVDTAATADECVQTKNDETFSDKWDRISTVISALLYIAVGAAFPINVLIFRSVINFIIAPGFTADLLQPNIISFAVLGAAMFAASFCASSIIGLAVQRQVRRIRLLYFQAVLRQDISWFDTQSSGALIGRLTENVDNIGQGIGTKFGEALQNFSGFLTAIIIAFVVGWQLTLVACAMLPVITVQFILFAVLTRRFTSKEVEAYSLASSIAGEVLSFIRTVVAFGGEKKEVDRYTNALGGAVIFGIKKSMAMNGVMGGIWLSTFSSSALIFWYGIKLMVEEGYDSGTVITVFMNVLMGSFYLGNALPNIQHFIKAKALAEEVYGTIDHVLQDFNLTLESGKTVALVGPSGSGKSTIIQMLQRYYDPAKGQVFVDGVDVRELDLKWYRRQLGCVQQEPLLFEGTIAENIRLGNPEATTEEIEEAAKLANAHEFIIQMPRTYETMIAERGGGMSGGQKQRIAIARALVSKPSVLLLDEATSALDTRSERVVQEALEKASVGRTVVTVAHRLTTVRNADQIMVLDKGMIRESGTHDELVHLNGLYAAMLKNQKRSESKEEEDEQEDALEEGAAVAPARSPDEEGVLDQKIWQLARDGSEDDTLSESIASQHSSGQRSLLIFQSKLSKFKRSPLARILKLNRPELMYIVLGAICCIFAGGAQPAFAVLYSEVYQIFTLIGQPDEMQRQVNLIAGLMVLIGVIRFLSTLGSGYFFGVSGERLTTRVRSTYFRSIIRQEIGWFDRSENQAGALTAKLATEASSLKSLSGSSIGLILESLVLIVASLVIAFIYSWQLTLLFLVFMPLIILAGMMQAKRMTGKSRKVDDTVAVRCAQEVFYSYTVVTTLTLEDFFYDKYKKLLHESYKSDTKGNLMFSLAYALTQSVPMFSFAAVFTLGGYLIEQGTINVLALFRVFSVMNMGSQSLGRTASFISDIKRASRSSKVILQTMDRTPRIITEEGILPDKPFTGNITFKRVYFRYPTRREIRALKNFSFVVEPNQTVALVGQSGCGKSTLLQLVQRFYDPSDHGPDSGIFFDNWNLCDVKPEWTRRQIGIVSQEPNLFDMTLRENIAYGDNSREVSMEEVIEAARKANIHDYIASLPEGYETMAGQRGSRLSGGQKQRVAIARALLRKPVLLLLDEATSALDNESERVVQEALDAAAESRTTLVVAHRLTTVKDADEIVVLEGGRKIETGDPESLMLAKGAFYALHNVEAKH